MEKRILNEYKLTVYSDGSVSVAPLKEDKSLDGCSSSVKQIVLVLQNVLEIHSNDPQRHIHSCVTESVNVVARNLGITASAVHAKLTRKTGVSMEDFKRQLGEYINNQSDVFRETLENSCVTRNREKDLQAVENILAKLRPEPIRH